MTPKSSVGAAGVLTVPDLVNVYITNWKITMLSMGKSTISMVIFNSYVTNYQRVRYLLVNLMVIQNGLLDSWPVPLLSFAPFR